MDESRLRDNPNAFAIHYDGDIAEGHKWLGYAKVKLKFMLSNHAGAVSSTFQPASGVEIQVYTRPNRIRIMAGGGVVIYYPDRFTAETPYPPPSTPNENGDEYSYYREGAKIHAKNLIGKAVDKFDNFIASDYGYDVARVLKSKVNWYPPKKDSLVSLISYNDILNSFVIHVKIRTRKLSKLHRLNQPVLGLPTNASAINNIIRVGLVGFTQVSALHYRLTFMGGFYVADDLQYYSEPLNIAATNYNNIPAHDYIIGPNSQRINSSYDGGFLGDGITYLLLTREETQTETSNGVFHIRINKIVFNYTGVGIPSLVKTELYHKVYAFNEFFAAGVFNKFLIYSDSAYAVKMFTPNTVFYPHENTCELWQLVSDTWVLVENTTGINPNDRYVPTIPTITAQGIHTYLFASTKHNLYVYALDLSGLGIPTAQLTPEGLGFIVQYDIMIKYMDGDGNVVVINAIDIPITNPEIAINNNYTTPLVSFNDDILLICANYFTIIIKMGLKADGTLNVIRYKYRVDNVKVISGSVAPVQGLSFK
jgi:hypothetical protein